MTGQHEDHERQQTKIESDGKIYDARRYEQEKNGSIVDKRLQGLEYPEEMRNIKESYAALPMSVPLHDLDKKYQPSGAGGTCSPPATPHRLQNPKWMAKYFRVIPYFHISMFPYFNIS